MTRVNEVVVEFNRSVQRHLNCLSDENRNVRLKALKAIEEELGKNTLAPENFEIIFLESLLSCLLRSFTDSVEKIRELSLKMIESSFMKLRSPEKALVNIIPSLVRRLGQQELIEPSEEIRLQSVNLLFKLIETCSKDIAPFVGELVKILQQTLVDSYPEVKKSSCFCSSLLAKSCPQHFHMESELLIRPLLLSIIHQHSKVRVQVINTIGTVIQYGNNKSIDDVVSHLAQRMFDNSVPVRLAVVSVVGGWLLDLPDRYSYQYKLLPLLLSGVTDEVPEVRCEADALWNDVGEKYLLENEEQLKDKIDFEKPLQGNYPSAKSRPNLGCRQLVYSHYSKILPAIGNDIVDWIVETRVKAGKLLYELILNEESNVLQHLDKTLECLYKASADAAVVADVMKCAQLLGFFVSPHVWMEMVMARVASMATSGCMLILAHLIRGSPPHPLLTHLPTILEAIVEPGILHVLDNSMQKALLVVVEGMLVCGEEVLKGGACGDEVVVGEKIAGADGDDDVSGRNRKRVMEGGDGEEDGVLEGGDGEKRVLEGVDGEEDGVEKRDGEEGRVEKRDGEEDRVEKRGGEDNKMEGVAISHSIFYILFYVKALATEMEVDEKATQLIERMDALMTRKKENERRKNEFRSEEGEEGMEGKWVEEWVVRVVDGELMGSRDDWTTQSPELKLFETLLSYKPSCIPSILPSILAICQANLHPDKHHALKHRFFALLSDIVSTFSLAHARVDGDVVKRVVMEMILPNLVWRVGRMAEVVRKSGVSCLWSILSAKLAPPSLLLELVDVEKSVDATNVKETRGVEGDGSAGDGGKKVDKEDKGNSGLLCIIKGLLEDDNQGTRLTTLHLVSLVFEGLAEGGGGGKEEGAATMQVGMVAERQIYNFYPELLKRLDDRDDDVRMAACASFSSYLSFLLPLFDCSMYSAHLLEIFKGLLVHMDDVDSKVQEAVFSTLKKISQLAPEMMLQLVDEVRFKHRSTKYCDSLTQHIHSLKL